MVKDVSPVGLVVLIKHQKYHVTMIWTKIKHVSGIVLELMENFVKRRYVIMPLI